jgi:hypothetical protein
MLLQCDSLFSQQHKSTLLRAFASSHGCSSGVIVRPFHWSPPQPLTTAHPPSEIVGRFTRGFSIHLI